jgi:hypothetical protein
MAKRVIHVVPHNDGCATREEGAECAGSVHDMRVDAVARDCEKARRERVDVIIHDCNGKIQDSDSYGNDPFPPRDRKY